MNNTIILNNDKIKVLFNLRGVRQKLEDFPLVKLCKGEKGNIRRIKRVIDIYILRIIIWGEIINMEKEEGGFLLKEPYLSELMKEVNIKGELK